MPAKTAQEVLRGTPPSALHQPNPVEFVDYLTQLEAATITTISYFDDTLVDLNARTGTVDGQFAAVMSNDAEGGIYERVGGTWTKVASIPAVLTESLSAEEAKAARDAAIAARDAAEAFSDLAQANANDSKVYASEADLPVVTIADNGTWARVLHAGGVQAWLVVTGAWAFQSWLEGPRFDTIAEMAASDSYSDGDYTTVFGGDNNEPETFKYVAASTLTANGTTVVTATGMGVGQHVSTRKKFKTDAEFQADPRPDTWFATGDFIGVGGPSGYTLQKVATGEHRTTDGGAKFKLEPGVLGYNIRALGSDGTLANDTAAFNEAIALANAVGATGSSGMETNSVTISLPDGAYDLSNGLSEYIKKDNIFFCGSSPDGAIIKGSAGTIFRWGAEADPTVPNGGGLKNIKFLYPTAPNPNAICVDLPNAVRQSFTGIRLRNVNRFASLGSATKQAIAIGFSDVRGWVYNSGLPTYDLVNGAGFYLEQSVMFVQGVPVPSTYGTHTAVDGTDFIRCQGKWDTILVNSVTCNRYDRSLNFLNTLNNVINNIKISQFYGDYSKRGAIFGAPVGATGANNTTLISLAQCWFVAINGDGLTFTVDALGGVSNVTLTEVQTTLCSGDGIKFQCPATAIKDVDVTDCSNLGAAGGGAGSGLLLDGVADITVKGGRYGLPQVGVLAAQAVDGVKITAASRRYNVSGVHATGSASDYNIVDPAAGPAGCLVAGNHNTSGTKPTYATNPTSAAVPASGVDYPNTSPFRRIAYGYAGTVTAFRHNSIAVAGAGNSTIILDPGDAWSSVYSAAPQLLIATMP